MPNSTLDTVADLIGFQAEDRERLAALAPHAKPLLPMIAHDFIRVVTGAKGTAIDEDIQHCLERGLTGPWNSQLFEACKRIGREHAERGVAPYLVVAAINGVRAAYRRISDEAFADDRESYASSIDKLLDVELSIILHAYHRRRMDQLATMQTLTSGLAHELRNPINSAKLQLEVLARRLRRRGEDVTLTDPATRIGEELDRLDALLDDFLDYAQPMALHFQTDDLVAIVTEVVTEQRAYADHKGVTLAFTDHPETVRAEVDRGKLRRVVANLLRNAIEAVGERGHVTVRIAVDSTIHLVVVDDGPGIPDLVRTRIFEPFFSTHSGTGLGMSIVSSIVAMHGGTVHIETSPVGTRIDVALPVVRALHESKA